SLLSFPFCFSFFFLLRPPPPRPTLFPYTTLFRSVAGRCIAQPLGVACEQCVSAASRQRPPCLLVDAGSVPAQPLVQRKQCRYHRSEEHTSELQSRENLVCRLLLEKKKKKKTKKIK